jgi:hypothetical protein
MIARRRIAFLRLCTILRSIEADLGNLDAVRALNVGVLKEILRDEVHIRRLRTLQKELNRKLKTERPKRAEALLLRKQIKRHQDAIEGYENQLFTWRCIADGLVYAYISTFNVKHAYFDTATLSVKPSAGFIGGKVGHQNELDMLHWAIEHRVPAVLSDITNVIRYGDICLLSNDDPYPVEVKSARALNQRGKRQAAQLSELDAFLTNDMAIGFRGMPDVRRVEFSTPSRDCLADLNACIQSARCDGWNVVCPERGLVYAAIFGGAVPNDLFECLGMTRPAVFLLNSHKTSRAWAPYLPFTNSIRDLEDLYDFVVGKLSVIVFVDAAVLCDHLAVRSWKSSLIEHADYTILMEHTSSGAKFAISSQFFRRFGLEFMSIDWFMEHDNESIIQKGSEIVAGQSPLVDMAQVGAWTAEMDAAPRIYAAVPSCKAG